MISNVSQPAIDAFLSAVAREAAKRKRARSVTIPRRDFTFRGAALEIQSIQEPAWIISGPAETGKTLAALHRLHCLACDYPGFQGVIARKRQVDLSSTCIRTFIDKVLPKNHNVRIYGGEKPERFIYPNGSVLWAVGLDNPGKVLSGEFDGIYWNQAEQGILSDWEILTTRATGRAGHVPRPMCFGDCNPAGEKHFIPQLAKEGRLKLLKSYHKDNPSLFDDSGVITAQGKRTLSTLENLTGARRARLLEGKWSTPEGVVYDGFSADVHVTHRDISEFGRFGLALDEGYTNPAVILLIGIDGDNRLHVIEEFYHTGVLQENVVRAALEMSRGKRLELVAVDAAAAGLIADLANNGIPAAPHKGRVLDGIQLVQNRLKVQGDGKPRLTIEPTCTNTINEFESYVWKPGKDEPVKADDHALDALRYFCVGLESTGFWVMRG